MGGMVQVLESVMHYGCLSTFIGMTTDSRSLLSFSRHDYFRRVLCNWLGEKARSGELASDEESLICLAKKLCYENAAEYLGLAVEA
jgi:glucuronate isomerase